MASTLGSTASSGKRPGDPQCFDPLGSEPFPAAQRADEENDTTKGGGITTSTDSDGGADSDGGTDSDGGQ